VVAHTKIQEHVVLAQEGIAVLGELRMMTFLDVRSTTAISLQISRDLGSGVSSRIPTALG
jgi:hypothetical protein